MMPNEHLISTDVLALGGGIAGLYAAIKASELPVRVVLVDKAFPGRSGNSFYASGTFCGFQKGDDLKEALRDDLRISFYLDDQIQASKVISGAPERRGEMEEWGIQWVKDERGNVVRKKGLGMLNSFNIYFRGGRHLMTCCRGEAIRRGVYVMDRIMITDLLTNDGAVVGAVGFHCRTGEFYCFRSKATILATGCFDAKAGQPQYNLTGDGVAAAMRVGAELRNMEQFNWTMAPAKFYDRSSGCHPLLGHGARLINRLGEQFVHKYLARFGFPADVGDRTPRNVFVYAIAKETLEGRGPICMDIRNLSPHDYQSLKEALPHLFNAWAQGGLDPRKDLIEYTVIPHGSTATGGIRINEMGATNIPGLYCAGDASDRMWAGVVGLTGAVASGVWAGSSASRHAVENDAKEPLQEQVEALRNLVYEPLRREKGLSTKQALRPLQKMLYEDIGIMRTEAGLKKVIDDVRQYVREELPTVKATDVHDLVKANELRNIAEVVEAIAQCSLFRTETRYFNIREDYPARDDTNWLKWVIAKRSDDGFVIHTEDIPQPHIPIEEMSWA